MRRHTTLAAILVLCAGYAAADNMVVNGTFESGNLGGWSIIDYYPTAPPTVFTGQFVDGYPMLEEYAGTYSMGWQRHELGWAGTTGDSTQPCSYLRQNWYVDPGTYPVSVTGAFFLHHDREGEPEDDWGEGITVSLYCDGVTDAQWQHVLWPREGDSFWIVKGPGDMDNETGSHLDQITTSIGQVTLEIAWTTKWNVDMDIAAVDNIAVDLVGASKLSGPPADEIYAAGSPIPDRTKRTAQEALDDRAFYASYDHPVGLDPSALVAADFDEDGHADVIACCEWSHELAVLLGDGTGDLGAPTFIPSGYNPRGIVAEDFNGDDDLDVAVSCKGSGDAQVFLGNGDGTFGAPLSTSVGPGCWGITTGYFDADDDPDLAVVSEIEDLMHVLIGVGDGTFTDVGGFPTGSMGSAVITDDFDNDTKADLLVGSFWDGDGFVYKGDGAGGFTELNVFGMGWELIHMVSADFNNDNNVDVLSCHTHPSVVKIYFGNGNGTFYQIEDSNHGVHVPMQMALADFNDDGELEVATPAFSEKEVGVLYGFGKDPDIYYEKSFYQCEDTPRSVAVADFDEDGRPDIVIGNGDTGSVSVMLTKPDGLSHAATAWDGGGFMPTTSAVAGGDFDNDGDTDFVTSMTGASKGIHVHEQTAKYQVATDPLELHYGTSVAPPSIDVHDFDGDDNLDLLYIGSASSLGFQRGNADLSFQSPSYLWAGGGTPHGSGMADFDDNGTMDAITTTTSQCVVTLLNDGAGHFSSRKITRIGSDCYDLAVGYFNADDYPDFAGVATDADRVYWATGIGDGLFNTDSSAVVGDDPTAVDDGDFDDDGNADLAVACGDGDRVTILYGDGAGGFGSRQDIPLTGDPADVIAYDFNGDGICDFAVARSDRDIGQATSLFISNGDRTYDREDYWAEAPRRLALADAWGDGLTDLLVAQVTSRYQILDNRTFHSTSGVGWLKAGWNLMSIPLDPIGSDSPEDVLADAVAAGNSLTNNLFDYSKATGYQIYPSQFGALGPGEAYWLYLSTGCQNTMVGAKAQWDEVLPLDDGWNMTGCPQGDPVALSDCRITDGSITLTIPGAESAGWIQATMFFFDTGGYGTAAPSGADDDSLRPWYGYWLLTYQPGLSLIVPKP